MESNCVIYSIGHSNHELDRFIELLNRHQINAVVDVRSVPFSKYNPQFNRDFLSKNLKLSEINYIFFGKELGARSEDPTCYENGQVVYSRLAKKTEFRSAISRLIEGSKEYNIALMCSEREPLECHRTILIAEEIAKRGMLTNHILANGDIEPHQQSLIRLLTFTNTAEPDMFHNQDCRIQEAVAKQESRIAYRKR